MLAVRRKKTFPREARDPGDRFATVIETYFESSFGLSIDHCPYDVRNGDKDKDIGRYSAAIADGITRQYGEDYRDGAEHLDARFGQMRRDEQSGRRARHSEPHPLHDMGKPGCAGTNTHRSAPPDDRGLI